MKSDESKQLLQSLVITFIIIIEIIILAVYFNSKPQTLLYREPDKIVIRKNVIPEKGEETKQIFKQLVITDKLEIQKIMNEINGSKCKKVNYGSLYGKTIYDIHIGDNKIIEVFDNYHIKNNSGVQKLLDNPWDFIYEYEFEEYIEN